MHDPGLVLPGPERGGPLRLEPEVPQAADPTLAVAAYLKADARLSELVEGRVYRPEIPMREDPKMSRPLVVVRPSGGGTLFSRDYLPVMDSRIDVVSYGSSRLEAENIAREVALALKNLQRSKWKEVVLFWARVSGNPASAIDPDTNWAFALVVAQVMHSLYKIP